ncbi:MAG TPA: amidohydrolase family protein [Acidimicrobiales bacterium]|nr:amidohydrolase family protein [Acidimicrobiales bacterium]
MLIVRAEVGERAGLAVRVAGEAVVEVGPDLRPAGGEEVIDAGGGAVIPALHDHHVHLRAMAAARASVDVGPATTPGAAAFDERLRAAAAAAPAGGWVRAVGYHEAVAGDLDRRRLDAAVADRPVRVQHRSGALWVLNSAALAALPGGDDPPADGRLWRRDGLLAGVAPPVPLDWAGVGRDAAARGVAGFTDADPTRTQDGVDALAAAARRGDLAQRVVLMSAGGLALDAAAGQTAGPRKLLLDDATLPPVDDIAAWMAAAHAAGEPVAVHCVTRLQLVATVTALAAAGARPGDRVEHGAVVPAELAPELARLGVTVVTQPNFVAERGDEYRAEVDADDLPLLYPCASLRAAGVRVAAGTDAPFGGADPWAAVRAAVDRRTRAGAVLGPGERVDPASALGLFLGRPDAPAVPRRVEAGAPADLCVLDRPLAAVLAGPGPNPVAVTVARGRTIADNR